jgi:hypothetical protein
MSIKLSRIHPKAGSGIGLRVKVDDEGALPQQGKGRAKINGCCGLAYAAFLIGYAYYLMRHKGAVP